MMKVAIWLDADYRPEEGGGFSYYDKLVKSLDSYAFDSHLDICFVSNGDIKSLPLIEDNSLLRKPVPLQNLISSSLFETEKCLSLALSTRLRVMSCLFLLGG